MTRTVLVLASACLAWGAGCGLPGGSAGSDSDERLAPADLDRSTAPAPAEPPFVLPPDDGTSWKLWGGPSRDFRSAATGLAASWPAEGPPVLWRRPLGEGYSGIAVEEGVLYTMYRSESGEEEVVAALDAATGATVWEHRYQAPFTPQFQDPGPGPYAMPQIVGDLVVSVGGTGKLHALDKHSGELAWSRDVYADFGGTYMTFGYSNHPLVYRDMLIVMTGGQDRALTALRIEDGSEVWSRHSFRNSYSTPVLINVDGQDQVVAFLSKVIVGVDPHNGDLLWSQGHDTGYDLAIIMPVWGPDNLLLYSSADGGGCGALRLDRAGPYTVAEQVWHTNQVRFHFASVVRIGGVAYGSSGKSGVTPMTAVDAETGEVLWRSREFAKANFLLVEDRLLLLDEEGVLGLARVSPEGVTVDAKFQLFDGRAWTIPSLVGRTIYVRDRREILALDLGTQ